MKKKKNSFFEMLVFIIFTSIVYFVISLVISGIINSVYSLDTGRILSQLFLLLIFFPTQYLLMIFYLGFEHYLKIALDDMKSNNIFYYYIFKSLPVLISFLLYSKFYTNGLYYLSGIFLLIPKAIVILLTYAYFHLFLRIMKKGSPEVLE